MPEPAPFRPTPFQPRPITPGPLLEHAGYRLKTYEIHRPGDPPAGVPLADGLARVLAALPQPARSAARPGLGFLIRHLGETADYLVLTWYDRENEMPQKILIRDRHDGAAWTDAAGAASFCVWDQQVIHHERDAYVRTMLGGSPDEAAYLADVLRIE